MTLTAPKNLTPERKIEAMQYLAERNQRKPAISISAWLAEELRAKRIQVK